jgi:hypothetical protein
MINFVFSPVVRFLSAVGAVLIAIAAIYGKGRKDARQNLEHDANEDALKRTQAAVRSGDAVDINRLRDNDGHRRD